MFSESSAESACITSGECCSALDVSRKFSSNSGVAVLGEWTGVIIILLAVAHNSLSGILRASCNLSEAIPRIRVDGKSLFFEIDSDSASSAS